MLTSTWLMSVDITIAERTAKRSNIRLSIQPTLWLSLAVDIHWRKCYQVPLGGKMEVRVREVECGKRMLILGDYQDWSTSWYAVSNWWQTWFVKLQIKKKKLCGKDKYRSMDIMKTEMKIENSCYQWTPKRHIYR